LGEKLLNQLFAKELEDQKTKLAKGLANYNGELAKNLADHNSKLAKDLADHNAKLATEQSQAMHELQRESSVQLERLRAALQNEGFREQHKFSELFGRTLETVHELNRRRIRLVLAIAKVTDILQAEGDRGSNHEEFVRAWESFTEYFSVYELLLPPRMSKATRNLYDAIGTLGQQYLDAEIERNRYLASKDYSAATISLKEMVRVVAQLKGDLAPLREEFIRAARESLDLPKE
jgi:hypothetical protein